MIRPQFPREHTETGEFVRQDDAFRDWVSKKPDAMFPPETGRYHLYVSLACPWASRAVLARKLMGLEDEISMTVADPVRDDRGWAFRDGPGCSTDTVNQFQFLSEAYVASDKDYDMRVTVPVLWDKVRKRIVSNNEDDICRMFQDGFGSRTGVNWFPEELAEEQAKLSQWVHDQVNNAVYRAGFATRQSVYARACLGLFNALDQLEDRLETRRFLLGAEPVETDWRLFCTLVRFDAVYHGHFKCNMWRIVDYPNLQGYLMDLFQLPGVADTVNMDHIKRHYYITHDDINPTKIVPLGPELDLTGPHDRKKLVPVAVG